MAKDPNDATTHEEMDAIVGTTKRGRPAGKVRAKRQNYADDLRQLQTRVAFAVRLLKKITETVSSTGSGTAESLVNIAIETLEQE
jgi:hypothetical protein